MRYHVLIVIGLLGSALVLRALAVEAHGLWFDEALSWSYLQFSWPEMFARLGEPGECNPPLYYAVLRGWALVWGESHVALRSLALLCGMVAVWAVHGFMVELQLLGVREPAKDSLGRVRLVALVAAALVAFSPLQIHASQQVRTYSMGAAFVAGSSWVLLRALRAGPGHRWGWALYGVLAPLFCYAHFLGLLATFGQMTFAASYLLLTPRPDGNERIGGGASLTTWRCRWSELLKDSQVRSFIATAAFVGIACLPAVKMAVDKGRGLDWAVPLSVDSIPHEMTLALLSTFAAPVQLPAILEWMLAIAMFSLLVYVLISCGWPGRFMAALGLLPIVLMLTSSLISGRSIFYCRYLTFFHVVWMASIALFLFAVRPLIRWPLLVGTLSAWAFYSYPATWDIIGPTGNEGMEEAVTFLLSRRAADEPIIAQRPITLVKARYYLRDRASLKLCTAIPSRLLLTQAPSLADDNLIPTYELLVLDSPGVWILSTSWYDETREVTFPLPGHWRLEEARTFLQDYPGEGPVMVYHYRAAR